MEHANVTHACCILYTLIHFIIIYFVYFFYLLIILPSFYLLHVF